MTSVNFQIKSDWTLFLDRDGVINERINGDYVKTLQQFRFLPGAGESIAKLSAIFCRIIVVTNQQGVGKGLLKESDLNLIHNLMRLDVVKLGGKIDAVYFAPYLAAENHPWRKPGTGMALQAKADFPEIDFHKSVMVGDSLSDMEFGKALGMKTVFIHPEPHPHPLIDIVFPSLSDFCANIPTI